MQVTVLTLTTGAYSDVCTEVVAVYTNEYNATTATLHHLEAAIREYVHDHDYLSKTEKQIRDVLMALRFREYYTGAKDIMIDMAMIPDLKNNSIAWHFETWSYEWSTHEVRGSADV